MLSKTSTESANDQQRCFQQDPELGEPGDVCNRTLRNAVAITSFPKCGAGCNQPQGASPGCFVENRGFEEIRSGGPDTTVTLYDQQADIAAKIGEYLSHAPPRFPGLAR